MKKVFRHIGLFFLRLSGMRVPEELAERVFKPTVLEYTYRLRPARIEGEEERRFSESAAILTFKARKFISSSYYLDENGNRVITLKLIVQQAET